MQPRQRERDQQPAERPRPPATAEAWPTVCGTPAPSCSSLLPAEQAGRAPQQHGGHQDEDEGLRQRRARTGCPAPAAGRSRSRRPPSRRSSRARRSPRPRRRTMIRSAPISGLTARIGAASTPASPARAIPNPNTGVTHRPTSMPSARVSSGRSVAARTTMPDPGPGQQQPAPRRRRARRRPARTPGTPGSRTARGRPTRAARRVAGTAGTARRTAAAPGPAGSASGRR